MAGLSSGRPGLEHADARARVDQAPRDHRAGASRADDHDVVALHAATLTDGRGSLVS